MGNWLSVDSEYERESEHDYCDTLAANGDPQLECRSTCNRPNKHNSNNYCYWKARGYDQRPDDVGDVHARHSNANNPNNPIYGDYAEHPTKYVARSYGGR